VVSTASSPLRIIGGLFGTLLEILGTAGIVVVFVIFFLVRREDLRDRFIRLVGHGQMTVTTQALDDAARRVSQYLAMQLAINVSFGVPVAIGLWLIGVPNVLLWGLLATALRFIPYIGAWIAACMPIGLALAISPGWRVPLMAVGLFLALELLINNVVEPWLYGSRTGVSPVAVIVAALFWAWLWGGIGLVLATPLTACLVVIGKYVPGLSFLNVLLGDGPVFDPPTRVYQRLLASDHEEAMELVEEYLKTKPLVQLYDDVLTPALVLAEHDRHRGELDEQREQYVYATLKEMIDELGERHADGNEIASSAPTLNARETDAEVPMASAPISGSQSSDERSRAEHLSRHRSNGKQACMASNESGAVNRHGGATNAERRVLCLPARDDADEIAATMLAQLLERQGWQAEAVSVTALASEMLERVAEREADVVCISATPPAAVTHARYLCKRLRARFPEARVVVGLWHGHYNLDKAKQRIACGDTVRVVTSFADAIEVAHVLMQNILLQPEAASTKDIK
jgi:methylmalonyl-CoA mutase cobalamin-binding subunit